MATARRNLCFARNKVTGHHCFTLLEGSGRQRWCHDCCVNSDMFTPKFTKHSIFKKSLKPAFPPHDPKIHDKNVVSQINETLQKFSDVQKSLTGYYYKQFPGLEKTTHNKICMTCLIAFLRGKHLIDDPALKAEGRKDHRGKPTSLKKVNGAVLFKSMSDSARQDLLRKISIDIGSTIQLPVCDACMYDLQKTVVVKDGDKSYAFVKDAFFYNKLFAKHGKTYYGMELEDCPITAVLPQHFYKNGRKGCRVSDTPMDHLQSLWVEKHPGFVRDISAKGNLIYKTLSRKEELKTVDHRNPSQLRESEYYDVVDTTFDEFVDHLASDTCIMALVDFMTEETDIAESEWMF